MDLTMYQVDAFADDVFKGNPAAVVPLKEWLPTEVMQAVALENNLSETAYFAPHADGATGHYDLRWFTPGTEVDLCGHATLASAYVIFEYLGEGADTLNFETRSGTLTVTRGEGGLLSMDFPANVTTERLNDAALIAKLEAALGARILDPLMRDVYSLFVLEREADVRNIRYSGAIADALGVSPFWGLLVTAPANDGQPYDFVSRFFAPAKGVPEDPVTGSAHCMLAPYWAERLGRNTVTGYQASPRGGTVICKMNGPRVQLSGRVAPYLKGTISI
jgi:PhzF family phenazine biosynthesis protein